MKRLLAITAALAAIITALAGARPDAFAQQAEPSPSDTSLYRIRFNTFRSRVEV